MWLCQLRPQRASPQLLAPLLILSVRGTLLRPCLLIPSKIKKMNKQTHLLTCTQCVFILGRGVTLFFILPFFYSWACTVERGGYVARCLRDTPAGTGSRAGQRAPEGSPARVPTA